MDASDLLLQAAAQTIDALSFTQTHLIDEDFRAHSRATINSVRSLQREQRNRIDQNYGPRAASADTIAALLKSSYRGEVASMELEREANERGASLPPPSPMTQSQCQSFKKEMKQRIHEWERAFREERGVAVTAHDKTLLRHVYELYKLVKNRLKESDSPRNANSEPNIGGASEPIQPQPQPRHTLSDHTTHNGETIVGGGGGGRNGPAGGMPESHSSSNQLETVSGAMLTAPASTTSSSINIPQQSSTSTRPASKGKPANQMSDDELATEKRQLKHILHRFESEFEQAHGRPPTKNDRRVWTLEYTRYGELKNEINRRSGGTSTALGSTAVNGEQQLAPTSTFSVTESI